MLLYEILIHADLQNILLFKDSSARVLSIGLNDDKLNEDNYKCNEDDLS